MSRVKHDPIIGNIKGKEINLKDYYLTIKKRIWIIVVVTIISTLAGYFYSNYNNVPLYQTSTRIIIGSESGDMGTLMVMIKDPIIMEKVKEELKLTQSAAAISEGISVEVIDDSRVVKISVIDQNPKSAAEIANATAEIFKREIVNILDFRGVQLLSAAKENPVPINETQNRTIIIAFVFGLIVGVGLVFLMDSLDGTIYHDRDVEDILGVPILGVISNMNRKKAVNKNRKAAVLESRGETIEIAKRKAEGY